MESEHQKYSAEFREQVITVTANNRTSAEIRAMKEFDQDNAVNIYVSRLNPTEKVEVFTNAGIRLNPHEEDGWNAEAHLNNMDLGEIAPGGEVYEYVDEVVLFGGAVRLEAGPVEITDTTIRVKSWAQDGVRRACIEVAQDPYHLSRGQ